MARSEIPAPPSYDASPDLKFSWGSVHVKEATQIIGFFGVILSTFFLPGLLFTTKLDLFWGISGICFFFFNVFVFTFLFIGLKREKSGFLLPYLIYQVFWIVVSIFWMMVYFYIFLKPSSNFKPFIMNAFSEVSILNENKVNDLLIRFSILFTINCAIIEFIISILCFYIVRKCYKYFNQLSEIRKNENMAMKYSSWDDI